MSKIGSSKNRSITRGFYLEDTQVEIVSNEELFAELETIEDEYLQEQMIERIVKNNLKSIHNIIYRRYGSRLNEILCRNRMTYGDIYSILLEALWRAVRGFDLSKGIKFTTYSYTCMHGDISKYFQRLKTPDTNLSADAPLPGMKEDSDEVSLLDNALMTDEYENVEEHVTNAQFYISLFDELEKVFKPRDMGVIRSYMSGDMTQEEIGQKYGVSQVQISRIIRKIQATARDIRERILERAV